MSDSEAPDIGSETSPVTESLTSPVKFNSITPSHRFFHSRYFGKSTSKPKMVRPDLANNRSMAILNAARDGGYAVPGICCYNIEAIIATVRAAEAARSPAMVLLFPWAVEYAGSSLVLAAANAAHTASVPVSLHLDHAQTPELVRLAADIPDAFDSIMCDMSHYEKEENLKLTRELSDYCHERGIASEAEPGRIEGGEDGVAETADLEAILTTPEQAEEFVATGIEMLAPAFGNVHGEYGPRGIRLEYDRLESINQKVGDRVRLVLHGADPFDEEIFTRCIKAGVTKININKGANKHYARVQEEMRGKPLTSVIEAGTDAMQKAIEQYMVWLGSAGKA
jgi:fructose-bisphosphate aldolase, class II